MRKKETSAVSSRKLHLVIRINAPISRSLRFLSFLNVAFQKIWLSKRLPPAQRVGEQFPVREFHHAAGGHASRQPRDGNRLSGQQVRNIEGRSVSLQGWIRRHHEFSDLLFTNSADEGVDRQIFRTHAVERRNPS